MKPSADRRALPPCAVQRRGLTFKKERGATILIPTTMLDSLNPDSVMGLITAGGPLKGAA
jgi:hypothetical protein